MLRKQTGKVKVKQLGSVDILRTTTDIERTPKVTAKLNLYSSLYLLSHVTG